MRGRALAKWGATLGVVVLTGCGLTGPDGDLRTELERNRALWDTTGLATYEYGVERICFCGVEARGPVLVNVEAGSVLSRRYVDSGDPVLPGFADLFPTVVGLFDVIEGAIEDDAFNIDVSWDIATGLPTDIFIDYDESVADEEVGFRITQSPGNAQEE
jgi:uncharacterized protein DUF6174